MAYNTPSFSLESPSKMFGLRCSSDHHVATSVSIPGYTPPGSFQAFLAFSLSYLKKISKYCCSSFCHRQIRHRSLTHAFPQPPSRSFSASNPPFVQSFPLFLAALHRTPPGHEQKGGDAKSQTVESPEAENRRTPPPPPAHARSTNAS